MVQQNQYHILTVQTTASVSSTLYVLYTVSYEVDEACNLVDFYNNTS